jgi:hypothetical protein
MCDYSLENNDSRTARVGDRLQTTGFYQSITRGFCAMSERHVAVCLLPGTELAFDDLVMEEGFMGFYYRVRNRANRAARFRHVNVSEPNKHHDALEFSDGHIVLLTRLRSGQNATVLQLPVDPVLSNRATPSGRGLTRPVLLRA